MTIKITGNLGKLEKWIDDLRELGRKDVLEDINRACAREIIELIREGFKAEQAPTGSKWAPLKKRSGRILQDTARLRNSFHVQSVSARGFHVTNATRYGQYHQKGTKFIPKRPMVPDGRMPSRWGSRLVDVGREVLRERR